MSLRIYYRLKLDYFINYLRSSSKNLKQSVVVLLFSSIVAVIAGLFLGYWREVLLLLPGLIILLPGAIDMRGSIFAALGSRLSSSLHLGTITSFNTKNRVVRNNIFASLALSLVLSVLLGILARAFSFFFGLESISMHSFILISVLAGFVSGVVLLILTFAITFKSFDRGWDPDNVVAPLITTAGDFFTIPSLLFSAYIILHIEEIVPLISYFIISISVASLLFIFLKKGNCRNIVFQSLSVLSFTIFLSLFSGILIESNIRTLVLIPSLLVMLPAFIGQCGNIGNILASRLSTALHLGFVSPEFRFNKRTRIEFFNSFLLSIVVFPVISILTFSFSLFFGIPTINLANIILTTTIAGIFVILILSFVAFCMSVLSFKFNIDPDNVIIPIVTNTADIIGVLSLLAVLNIFGIL